MRRGSRSAGMMWEIPRKLAGPLAATLPPPPPPPPPPTPPPPKLKLAPEVMNYFNEFTGVTRWRLVDYRGLSNLRICIKHECPALSRGNLPRSRARARKRKRESVSLYRDHEKAPRGRLHPRRRYVCQIIPRDRVIVSILVR